MTALFGGSLGRAQAQLWRDWQAQTQGTSESVVVAAGSNLKWLALERNATNLGVLTQFKSIQGLNAS